MLDGVYCRGADTAVFQVARPPTTAELEAFAYHLALNLDHLSRESVDVFALLLNPLATGAAPRTMTEIHEQMMAPLRRHVCAAAALGFWLARQTVRHRGRERC